MRRLGSMALAVTLAASASCQTQTPGGELSRSDCASLVSRRNAVMNAELGRAVDTHKRLDIDHCMAHGTRRAFTCYRNAKTPRDVRSCDALMR